MFTLKELDEILLTEEEQYYSEDLFLTAEELIEQITSKDINTLVHLWSERDPSWQERFAHSSAYINQEVLQCVLEAALANHSAPSTILGLMTRLPKVANQSPFTESLLRYAVELWHTAPKMHTQIEVCTWSCGLSNRLLKQLGFNTWKEARE